MILSFKPQFVEPILDFSKIHTIRLDPHNRWKAGTKIHFATGIRTKSYRQFMEGECKGVQKIEIKQGGKFSVWTWLVITINGKGINEETFYKLCRNDGFGDTLDFENFFFPKKQNPKIFKGKIIHWTDFKY